MIGTSVMKELNTWHNYTVKMLSNNEGASLNHLSANFTKWSNTLKQFVGKLATNCLSVFDHFAGLALKSLMTEAVIIYKPVHWFAEQYNGLRHERVKGLKNNIYYNHLQLQLLGKKFVFVLIESYLPSRNENLFP